MQCPPRDPSQLGQLQQGWEEGWKAGSGAGWEKAEKPSSLRCEGLGGNFEVPQGTCVGEREAWLEHMQRGVVGAHALSLQIFHLSCVPQPFTHFPRDKKIATCSTKGCKWLKLDLESAW